MDIEPPIKSADADDKSNELSNDSTASQPQQLQEMAKSVSVSKEPEIPTSPINDSASLTVNAPITLATDIATPIKSVASVVEAQIVDTVLTSTAPITEPQAAVQPPNATPVPHHNIPPQAQHMAPHGQYQYPGQAPPRAPYYNIAPYNAQYSQYPYQYQQYGPHIAPSHPGYPGAAPAEAHPVYPQGQGPPTQQPLPATAQPLPQTAAPPATAQEPEKKGNLNDFLISIHKIVNKSSNCFR